MSLVKSTLQLTGSVANTLLVHEVLFHFKLFDADTGAGAGGDTVAGTLTQTQPHTPSRAHTRTTH